MSGEWYKQAKGKHLQGKEVFQDYLHERTDKFIVVDFYMLQCGWCEKFMPEWNRVVQELTVSTNGDIKFVKVDGTTDRSVASHFGVESFPTFVIIPPGSEGVDYQTWKTRDRTYDGMLKWINRYMDSHSKGEAVNDEPVPQQAEEFEGQELGVFEDEMEVLGWQNGALQYLAENVEVSQGLNNEILKQIKELSYTQADMMELLQPQDLAPAPVKDNNELVYLFGGILFGFICGMFFANFLLSSKKKAKKQNMSNVPMNQNQHSDFAEVSSTAAAGSASKRSMSKDASDGDEATKFL